ncbi:MAG: PmoA family protein [Bacteroidales bacterium]|jgi:hypothetical protein
MIKRGFNSKAAPLIIILFSGLVTALSPDILAQAKKVSFARYDEKKKVDVLVDGKLFTTFRYSESIEKPFLFPVYAPNGSVITRGFPIEPRKGERVDHPHQAGIWFNHGNINGIDFWNNSSAIPPDKKDEYGHIVCRKIVNAVSGRKALLEVISDWDDSKGNTLLVEDTKYFFSAGRDSRTIDHISVLTAVNGPVTINDCKEGLFAIRVDRAFEMPAGEDLILTDEKGNPSTVKAMDNNGVTGTYTSSSGLRDDKVWGTRNEWVILSGTKDNTRISMAIFDNPGNPGFPAYSHARGYGLFSLNNFGQNSYDPTKEKVSFTIRKGESVTLKHRFYLQSGEELTPDKAANIFREFKKAY